MSTNHSDSIRSTLGEQVAALACADVEAAEARRASALDAAPEAQRESLGELLQLAIEVGILRGFATQATAFVTTKSRPWPGTGYERITDDPHVLRRFGRFVSQLEALEALFADLNREAEHLLAELGLARLQAAQLGNSEISGIIELLGAGSASEKYGFHKFWIAFQRHVLNHPPRVSAEAIGRALSADPTSLSLFS